MSHSLGDRLKFWAVMLGMALLSLWCFVSPSQTPEPRCTEAK